MRYILLARPEPAGGARRYLGPVRSLVTIRYKGSKRDQVLSDVTRDYGDYVGGHQPHAVHVVTPTKAEISNAPQPQPWMRSRSVPAVIL